MIKRNIGLSVTLRLAYRGFLMRAIPVVFCLSCFVMLLAFASTSVFAKDALPDGLAAKIDKVASDALAKSGVPSASIAVVRDGKLVYAKAYGDAECECRGKVGQFALATRVCPKGQFREITHAIGILLPRLLQRPAWRYLGVERVMGIEPIDHARQINRLATSGQASATQVRDFAVRGAL